MRYHRHQVQLVSSPAAMDLVNQFKQSLTPVRPWDSIIDFATHRSFCGMKLYPRQQTFLKLVYLETENMTPYDFDVIEEWRKGFDSATPEGVQPDIWERVDYLKKNGYTHFPSVQAVLGRRASKGLMGGIIGSERMAYMASLSDPQGYYGIDEDKDIFLFSLATNTVQAKMFQFADIKSIISRNKWLTDKISTNKDHYVSLRTDADVRRIAGYQDRGLDIESEFASIRALPISPSSSSARGASAFVLIFDEMAFLLSNPDSANSDAEVVAALSPSLDQFGKDAFTLMPSSPFSKSGQFFEFYKQGKVLLEEYQAKVHELIVKDEQDDPVDDMDEAKNDASTADPEMLIFQLPSWGLYQDFDRGQELVGVKFRRPIQYPPNTETPEGMRMLRLEKKNPKKFKVERRAQFASVMDGYLDERLVDKIFEPFAGKELQQKSSGVMGVTYHAHSDPSRTNANFALAIGHLEDMPEPDDYGNTWKCVVFDKTHVWRPKDFPGGVVDYVQIFEELKIVLDNFRGLELFTFDQWNSAMGIDSLNQYAKRHKLSTKVSEVTFGHKRNQDIAEQFKSAVNLEWVKAPTDNLFNEGEGCLLESELKFLREINGKVQKQEVGPVQTKDLADAVMEVTVRLLRSQFEKHSRSLMGNTRMISSMQSSFSRATAESMTSAGRGRRSQLSNFTRGTRHPFVGRR